MSFRIQIISSLLFLQLLAWPLVASGAGDGGQGGSSAGANFSSAPVGEPGKSRAEQLRFELDLEEALMEEALQDPADSDAIPSIPARGNGSLSLAAGRTDSFRLSTEGLEEALERLEAKERRYGEELDRMEQMAAELTQQHVPEWKKPARNAYFQYNPISGNGGELSGATGSLRAFFPETGKPPLVERRESHGFEHHSLKALSLFAAGGERGWGMQDYFSIRNGYIPPDSGKTIPLSRAVSSFIPASLPFVLLSLFLSLLFFLLVVVSNNLLPRGVFLFAGGGSRSRRHPHPVDLRSFAGPGSAFSFACSVFASTRSYCTTRRSYPVHFYPLSGEIS